MAYQAEWITVENGVTALLVKAVIMASYLMRAERPDMSRGWDSDLDDAWWKEAEATAANRQHKGKHPGLIFKRNVFTHQDPLVCGRFRNLKWDRPYAKADFEVTDPEEIAAILRGERTQLSIDGDVLGHLLWGVELTQGSEGHFSEDIPELRVTGVSVDDPQFKKLMSASATAARLSAPDADLLARVKVQTMADESNQPLQGNEPPAGDAPKQAFTPEQEAAIEAVIMRVIQKLQQQAGGGQPPQPAAQPAAASAKGGQVPDDKNPPGDAAKLAKIEKDLETERAANAQLATRVAELERDREIGQMVGKLRAANHPLDDDKLREQLVKMTTKEGREQCFARLESFKANRDDPPADPTITRATGATGERATLKAVLGAEYDRREKLNPGFWADDFPTKESYVNYQLEANGFEPDAPAKETAK